MTKISFMPDVVQSSPDFCCLFLLSLSQLYHFTHLANFCLRKDGSGYSPINGWILCCASKNGLSSF